VNVHIGLRRVKRGLRLWTAPEARTFLAL